MSPTDVLAGFATDFRVEQRLRRMVRSLSRAGFSVAAAGFREPRADPAPDPWEGCERTLFPLDRKRLPGFVFFLLLMTRLFRIARALRPRIFLACDLPALFPFALAARLTGGVVVYDSREVFTELPDVHGRPLKKALWTLLERLSIGKAGACMAVCDGDRSVLEKKYRGLKPVVVRNLPLFRGREPSGLLRQRLGLPPGEPLILFQGSFLTSGGVDELALAAERLDKGHVVLIGDGPGREKVVSLIRARKLEGRVHWIPPVPFEELFRLACSADIGVFPARPDGLNLINALPNKVFEYAMAGLPVISTDLPEIRKLNEQYDFALLVPRPSPVELAAAIRRLSEDPLLYGRLSVHGLRMAREMCWENEEGKFLALFEKV